MKHPFASYRETGSRRIILKFRFPDTDEGSPAMTNIWPIGGGKGGSGKSFLAGNLGIWLAKQGNKTLLMDADFGGANLHTMIGIPYQHKSLSDFLNKKVQTLAETVIETRIPNLFLISGAGNNLDTANMAYEQKMKVFRAIAKLAYDFILLDLGAGTSFNTIDFFLISDSGIFVTTPEPTSIENVYRLIRAVYARKIRQLFKADHFRALVEETEARAKGAIFNKPEYLLAVIKDLEPEKGKIVEEALRAFQFKLVLNQFRKQDHPKMGFLICRIIEKHLGLPMQFIGNIAHDDLVRDAVCQRVPFLDKYPHTQTAADLKKFCKHILEARSKGKGSGPAEEALEKAAKMDGNNGE
jgi:flagellar biosynthesis protein FlhG